MALLFLDNLQWKGVRHGPLEDVLAKVAHQEAGHNVHDAIEAAQVTQHRHQRVRLSLVAPLLVGKLNIHDRLMSTLRSFKSMMLNRKESLSFNTKVDETERVIICTELVWSKF